MSHEERREKPIETKLKATFGAKITPDEFEKFEASWTVAKRANTSETNKPIRSKRINKIGLIYVNNQVSNSMIITVVWTSHNMITLIEIPNFVRQESNLVCWLKNSVILYAISVPGNVS